MNWILFLDILCGAAFIWGVFHYLVAAYLARYKPWLEVELKSVVPILTFGPVIYGLARIFS